MSTNNTAALREAIHKALLDHAGSTRLLRLTGPLVEAVQPFTRQRAEDARTIAALTEALEAILDATGTGWAPGFEHLEKQARKAIQKANGELQ